MRDRATEGDRRREAGRGRGKRMKGRVDYEIGRGIKREAWREEIGEKKGGRRLEGSRKGESRME